MIQMMKILEWIYLSRIQTVLSLIGIQAEIFFASLIKFQ